MSFHKIKNTGVDSITIGSTTLIQGEELDIKNNVSFFSLLGDVRATMQGQYNSKYFSGEIEYYIDGVLTNCNKLFTLVNSYHEELLPKIVGEISDTGFLRCKSSNGKIWNIQLTEEI